MSHLSYLGSHQVRLRDESVPLLGVRKRCRWRSGTLAGLVSGKLVVKTRTS